MPNNCQQYKQHLEMINQKITIFKNMLEEGEDFAKIIKLSKSIKKAIYQSTEFAMIDSLVKKNHWTQEQAERFWLSLESKHIDLKTVELTLDHPTENEMSALKNLPIDIILHGDVMNHRGNVFIMDNLLELHGSMFLSSMINVQCENLTKITGHTMLDSAKTVFLPKVKYIGQELYIKDASLVEANSLEILNGALVLGNPSTLNMDNIKLIDGQLISHSEFQVPGQISNAYRKGSDYMSTKQ